MAAEPDTPKDEQRARLLDGLAAAIREKGLAQTQLGDIAHHAKTSRRTLYKHFHEAMVRSISRGEDVTKLVPELQQFLRSVARAETTANTSA